MNLRESLSKINFLDKIEVKKKYPNTIKIKVYEDEPIAVLNRKGLKFFICESSRLVPFQKDIVTDDLPNVFGEESEIYLTEFLNDLKVAGFPEKRIKNFYFFKIKRWDIQLKNDKIIKLPFTNVVESISQSIKLIDRKDFQKYKVIDLRISGKIIAE